MILYYVAALDMGIASVRYRAMLPALYLNRANVAAEVRAGEVEDSALKRATCLIIVKAFNDSAMELCCRAKKLGIPIVLDLCDDILDPNYGTIGGADARHYFIGMTGMASVVVTTTTTLAKRVRRHVRRGTEIHVVPDMVERPRDIEALQDLYRAEPSEPPSPSLPPKLDQPPPKGAKSPQAKLLKRLRRIVRKVGRRVFPGSRPEQPAKSNAPAQAEAPAPAPPEVVGDEAGKMILWFGHHGSAYSDTGMSQLLWLAGDLARLSHEHQFYLVVISNNRLKYSQIVQPLPFPTRYVEWSLEAVHAHLEHADVCVVPFGRDAFSLAKSPNRVLLSLASGVPVVTSELPSLGPLRDCVLVENWYESIRTYLDNPGIARAHLASAQTLIDEHYTGKKISREWRRIVELARKNCGAHRAKPGILFFFQLKQDFDLLLPLVRSVGEQFDVTVAILSRLALSAPELLETLGRQGFRAFFLHETEISALKPNDPRLSSDLLVTASESSAGPHIFASRLVQVAKAAKMATITLQHGIENVGLTYKDERYDESIAFGSDFILTWGLPERLAEWASEDTRSKIVPVGCPKPIVQAKALSNFPLASREFIVVFENLHWSRYSDAFRARFLEDLAAVARAFPGRTFVLKPHPAGQWFTTLRQGDAALPDNVIVADPASPVWRGIAADAFVALSAGVITTPSSTAFDAARYDKPVAIAAYDVDATMYDPLPMLASQSDWMSFVAELGAGTADHGGRLSTYRQRVSLAGDAMPRFLAVFRAISNGATRAEVLEAASRAGDSAAAGHNSGPAFSKADWRLKGVVDQLDDEELNELNAMLEWNAWVKDGSGRAFGAPSSSTKRARADALPDRRIVELNSIVPLADKTVLEVGCFEGIHTAALCNFAGRVKACDARVSLVAKTAVRCAFLGCSPELFLWNVETEIPDGRDVSCDVLHHVGVLYHLKNPVAHLQRILPHVRQAIMLDTHVATDERATQELHAGRAQYRVQRYREHGLADPFSGVYDHANWLLHRDILALLASEGFSETVVDRLRQERNGPRVMIIAKRPG
jgi:hypothetical protein